MSERVFNFSAGPAILPEPVIKNAQRDLWDIDHTGIGIMEHSHRGAAFTKVIEEAEADCREIAGIPDRYRILFLQGGASSQFFMIPMNLLREGQTADYVVTGSWSKKAVKEAKLFGGVHVAASSEEKSFTFIPKNDAIQYSSEPRYVHVTSNNTIAGTQWQWEPEAPDGAPVVCDASSDIFSRPIDISNYGVIYAGAQKNLGPSGVTLVIIREDLIEAGRDDLPTMLQYRTHAEKGSLYNTPPTFGIYVIGQVFKWIKEFGGLEAMQKYNEDKASIIYDYLDQSDFFRGTAEPDSRSRMNITFRGPNEDLEKKFIAEATAKNLVNLKGHRSVGGMRASVYNAFPREGCRALVDFMEQFEESNR
ncbi:MAG: 3-phosphoserine/phosphohydroxythreonine transaminase [Phycisphaerales bacterium]